MARTIVGVLRGGTGSEYDLSLKTGATILDSLPESDFDARDIFIDKKGMWHSRGMPASPAQALAQVDVVVSGLHGGIGEDGTVQRIIERIGLPYSGSDPLSSAIALNKIRAAKLLHHAGIKMPRSAGFVAREGMNTGEMARLVFAEFGPPYVVKPALEGASHGIEIAATIVELPNILADSLDRYGSALVEEYIPGEEASVGVIENFRNEELYALPPAHIVLPDEARILHTSHHLEGGHRHIVPSEFAHEDKRLLVEAAKQAHRALGLSDFSRSDFIVSKRGPYLLEVNSLPGLHEHASLPHMLESVGSSVKDFLAHAVSLSKR